ncbi:unnamed protein product [Cuscuta epithymum]|uniref:Uncharacterized protein n=1 Tax=Cuscuta epithymum TaxID=186058 RepID=A0AAV0CF69_9ASTE|nr:unnamed protein product [Cuscuta epithymum]
MMKMEVLDTIVHRLLVDNGSSVNILYMNTFYEIGLQKADLKPVKTPLSGFTGDTIKRQSKFYLTLKSENFPQISFI